MADTTSNYLSLLTEEDRRTYFGKLTLTDEQVYQIQWEDQVALLPEFTWADVVCGQTGMSAWEFCKLNGFKVYGPLEFPKNVGLSENPGDPRKLCPEPWPLKMGPVGGSEN